MSTSDLNEKLERIAKKHFTFSTLETRNSDHLDFAECAVWDIQAALKEAYELGAYDAYLKNVLGD